MRARTVWMVGILGSALLASLGACTSAATRRSVQLYEGGDYRGAAAAAERGITTDRDDEGAWRMKLRAALALGDAAGIASTYAAYREARGGDDDAGLARELAEVTIAQGLEAPSVALRIAAIRAVEQSELFDLADAVAQRMADRDDRVVAAAAAAVLRGYPDAATALDDMLRSEEPEARRIAVDGLGRKLAKHAVAELTAAAGDAEPAVRRTALGHLAELREGELAPLFQRHLGDADDGVRAACVRAFAALARSKRAVDAAAAALPVALRDRALAVRLAAVELASALDDRAAGAALLGDADVTVALAAGAALRSEAATLTPIFDRGLAAADWPTRVAALNQLAALLGPAVAQQRARRATGDGELAVRLAAARVLWHSGAKPEAIALLAAALEPAPVPSAAAGQAGAAAAAPAAMTSRTVEAAVDLMRFGDRRGEAALSRALLQGDSAELRAAAAAAHRMARQITPALLAALADASGAVRLEAAATLASLAKDAEE